MNDKLLKVSEVADILKVSQMTIIRRCRDGSVPFIMVGNLRRIREIDLEYFILTQSRNAQKPKATEPKPVYNGLSAEEQGFGNEEDDSVQQYEHNEKTDMTKLATLFNVKEDIITTATIRIDDRSRVSAYENSPIDCKEQIIAPARKYQSGFDRM